MEDFVDNCINKAEQFLNQFDIDGFLNKINELKYIVPIPENYSDLPLEEWDELDELHFKIPSKEELEYILMDLLINTYYMKSDNGFCDIHVIYQNDSVYIDQSYFDNELIELEQFKKEYEYDIKYVLPTKSYVGNCSKEFCEKIVEKYWEREYIRIQYITFPPLGFKNITLDKCREEFKRLQDSEGTTNQRSSSSLIKYFHKSIILANVGKSLSPFDGWRYIQDNKEAFKDFYRNRLRCSDWFKGKDRLNYLLRGVVMDETYGIGLSTSRKYQLVTYFKPNLAKYIIKKYLNEFNVIFDPFSGYSGRMLGVLASDKSYIGQDLCQLSIEESKEIYDFISPYLNNDQICQLSIQDSIKSYGEYECLFTCPPYGNIENWYGVKSLNYNCDKWIDICLSNYHCNKYVFVVDDTITKYRKYIKEAISNISHFAPNQEYIVVINKEDLKDIKFDDINGNYIESDHIDEYGKLGEHLYNIFNQQLFNEYVDCPKEFKEYLELIYNKFNQTLKDIRHYNINKLTLKENNKDILLACSGGLDSIYQIFQLQNMGYNVILYHMRNANLYESGQSYNSLKELSKKLDLKLITPILKRHENSNYTKYWAENPIKNQMIILNMIDYCNKNNINHICMDGSWEFSIDEVTPGIDVADAPENYDILLKCINKLVDNLIFIKTDHLPKIEKIKYLDKLGLMDYVYSCLGKGQFNKHRHNQAIKKYNIELFKYNCGHSCRKCAHHNLLMHYSNYKKFPQEFIEKCWNIMSENGFKSRAMLFDKSIPLENRIKNLYIE